MASLRTIPRSSFAIVLSALMLSTSILFGSFLVASGDSHATTFHACLHNGKLLHVVTAPQDCKVGAPVSWNAVGPQGEQGVPGEDGAPGAVGPQGVPGEDGVSGYEILTSDDFGFNMQLGPGNLSTIDLGCPAGKVAIGGGQRHNGNQETEDFFNITASHPQLSNSRQWTSEVINTSTDKTFTWTAFVVCAVMAVDDTP